MSTIYFFKNGKPVTSAKSACASFDCSDSGGNKPKVTRLRDGRAMVTWINYLGNAAFPPVFYDTEADAWEMIWEEVGYDRLDDALELEDKTFFAPIDNSFDTKDQYYKALKMAAMNKLNGLPFDEDLGI